MRIGGMQATWISHGKRPKDRFIKRNHIKNARNYPGRFYRGAFERKVMIPLSEYDSVLEYGDLTEAAFLCFGALSACHLKHVVKKPVPRFV